MRNTIKKLLAITTFVLIAGNSLSGVRAQSGGDNAYVLRVPPFMALTPLRGPQFRNHPLTPADIQFNNSLWWARTASATGSTVTFTTDTVFEHTTNPAYKRDVRLRLPRMFVSPGSGWQFDTQVDQTDYEAGDEIAMVQVSSTGPGVALIFMQVTFITGDVNTLPGGQYDVVVTGTISQN